MSETFLIQAFIKAMTIFEANNKMMSVTECADFLKCHKNTVVNRIERGIILATEGDGRYDIPMIQFLNPVVDKFIKESGTQEISNQDLMKTLSTFFRSFPNQVSA